MERRIVRANVDFNVDDTASSMVAFLRAIRPIAQEIDLGSGAACVLDLTRAAYLGPNAAAIVASLVLDARRIGFPFRVVLPEGPPRLRAFCKYSGLVHLIEGGPQPSPDQPESETVPLMFVRASHGSHTEAVVRLVERHTSLSEDAAEYLRISIREVLQNVSDHAKSPIGCVVCARYVASQHEVRVAVVDRGDTIPEVLWRRHPEFSPSTIALRRVIEGGYTTKSLATNQGQGISNLAAFVRSSDGLGRLTIVARDAYASVHHKRGMEVGSPVDLWFHGTAVFFTMKVG